MIPVSILFFFSGFAALVYELVWFRRLGLIFGNTVHAASTVLTAYMLGLALGAHLAGRIAPRAKRPVRLFALMEIAIGLYALCVPTLFSMVTSAYRYLPALVSLPRSVRPTMKMTSSIRPVSMKS